VFFGTAAVDPARFPLSPRQAARLKSIVKRAKGPVQPQSRRNKRKARQERRQSFHKRRRQERKQFTEQYNAAYAEMLKEQEEMEKAYAEIQARVANETKFDIVDGQGNLIMAGVPQSAIVMQDAAGDPTELPEKAETARIILPSDLE
jgi:hypothetical protein